MKLRDGRIQTAIALGALAGIIRLDLALRLSGLWLLGVVAVLVLIAAVRGQRSPLWLRLLATGATLYLGYGLCLTGRTMEPGLNHRTAAMAFLMFACYALLPTLALLRIWGGRWRIGMVTGMFPAALLLASCVAWYEEARFIRDHPQGSGPVARWTVPHHWLAYDANTGTLSGSD